MSGLADFAAKVVKIIRLRAVDSGRLYRLNGHVLKDIGLNRADSGGGEASGADYAPIRFNPRVRPGP